MPRPGPSGLRTSGVSFLPAAAAFALSVGLRAPGRLPDRRSRPRARLPGFPGVRSGRLFQPLSRSQPSFMRPSGAGKWLSGVPGAAQGHPERRFCPCRRRGLFLGLPGAAGFPRSAPLFWLPEARGAVFSSPAGSQRGAGGLKARTGASWGRPGPFSPSARASFLDPGGSQKPAGPFSAPGRCWEALEAVLRLESPHRGVLGPPGAVSGPFSSPPPPGLSPEPGGPPLSFF